MAGYGEQLAECIALLQANDCRVIFGNHDRWYLEQAETDRDASAAAYLAGLPVFKQANIEGKSVYMVHASPPDSLTDGIRLLDENGALIPEQVAWWSRYLGTFAHDVLIVGHTHQLYSERLAGVQVINPGSTCFNHACGILTLPVMQLELHGLSGHAPLRAWHWGLTGEKPG